MSIQALHERAVRVARDYLRCETELLEIFQELDRTKGFRALGQGSLFEYALSLGLSEGTAYALITVARKAVTLPALKESLVAGEMTLSNARRIAPILTPTNQDAWIERAKTLPKAGLERELAREFPKEAIPEKIKPISEDRASVTLSISNLLLEKLKRVQDLESSRTGSVASLEDALDAMAEEFLKRRDPVQKVEQANHSSPSRETLGPGQVQIAATDTHGRLRAIPAAISRAVWRRDQGQCTAKTPEGTRCSSRRWLHVHHLQEVSRGGTHHIDNLALLCASHHAGQHSIPASIAQLRGLSKWQS